MFHWYSPCLTFDVEDNGHHEAWTAHLINFITGPWVTAVLAGGGDSDYFHSSIYYIPFSSMGFGTLQQQSSRDTAVIFFETAHTARNDTVGGGRNPVTGSLMTHTPGGRAEILAVWEMNGMGHSHIYSRGFVFDFGDRVDDPSLAPTVVLQQNYPNPFNPTTTIQYSVPGTQYVSLRIYDLLGREVSTLVNEVKQPGKYNLVWDTRGLASGVYFYRMVAGSFTETKKLVLVR